MNIDYMESAKERMPNIPLLVNLISKRVRQLNMGQRPMVKPDDPKMPAVDIALKEVAEGKLTAEMVFTRLEPPTQDSLDMVISL